MKKFFAIAVCLLLAGSANAQTFFNGARTDYDEYFETRIGVSAGVGLSSTHGGHANSGFNSNVLSGFNLGGSIEYPISYKLIIRSELLYAQKGYTATTVEGNFTQRSHYIDIPLMAKLRAGKVNIYAGPQFSYMVANSYNFGNNFTSNQDFYKYTGSRTFISGVVGAGFDISEKVDLYARYAIDVKGINTNGSAGRMPSYRNQALQVSLGFQIN